MTSTVSIRATAPPPAAATGTERSKAFLITGGADIDGNTGRAVDDLIGDGIATEIETEDVDAAVGLTFDVDNG